jgi:hypothetical protein
MEEWSYFTPPCTCFPDLCTLSDIKNILLNIPSARDDVECIKLGVVYTMDHEVVPRKRPILRGMTSWDDFHGPSH